MSFQYFLKLLCVPAMSCERVVDVSPSFCDVEALICAFRHTIFPYHHILSFVLTSHYYVYYWPSWMGLHERITRILTGTWWQGLQKMQCQSNKQWRGLKANDWNCTGVIEWVTARWSGLAGSCPLGRSMKLLRKLIKLSPFPKRNQAKTDAFRHPVVHSWFFVLSKKNPSSGLTERFYNITLA